MTASDEVFDNPTGWVRSHIRRYVASDGEKGHRFNGYDADYAKTAGREIPVVVVERA